MSRIIKVYFNKHPERMDEYKKVKERYINGESLTSICKESIFERHILSKLLKEENIIIKTNRYSYNENAFKSIDDEQSAYWLGFMYADGNINELRMTSDLTLSIKDIKHLEKLREYIGDINIPITINESYLSTTAKSYQSCKLKICNKAITENLINNDCNWSKTYDIRLPKHIDKNYMHHFIRGFFDGDGNICNGVKQNRLSFTAANVELLNELLLFFNSELNMTINKITTDKRRTSTHSIGWGAKKDINCFYNYIYKNATIYLARKKEIYDNVIGRSK